MSKCERYRQWMHDAVDGDLASERVEQLDGHLASCSECRRQMFDLQALVSAASELPIGIEPKRDLWPEIEGRLVEVKTPRVSLAHVGLAVAAMVIIGVALSVLRTPESKPQFLVVTTHCHKSERHPSHLCRHPKPHFQLLIC